MIAMRSHKCATTARSWLTNIVVSDRVRRIPAIKLRISACTETSSDDVGSSRSSRLGARISARDRDALALTAGKLMRISEAMTRVEADVGESRKNRRFAVGKTVGMLALQLKSHKVHNINNTDF